MFVVDSNGEVYVDRDDAVYTGEQRTFESERAALECARELLQRREDALAERRHALEQRLKQLPHRFTAGDRVLVEVRPCPASE